MKKSFTLFMGLVAALAAQAQSDFPLQFADKVQGFRLKPDSLQEE